MIEIGVYNTLRIARDTQNGLYLADETGEEVLLPNKYVPKEFEIDQEVEVFVYLDHEHRKVATTLEPYIYLNEFAVLRVNYVNEFGAFLDWGLEKDLFVPFSEQARPMEKSKRYLVYMLVDEKSNRLIASSKTRRFLNNDNLTVAEGDEVEIMISHTTDLGINAIVNERHHGLLYQNEVFDEKLRPGDRRLAFVKSIRPDKKIDLVLQAPGYAKVEPGAQKIMEVLAANNGFLPLNDASDPDDIRSVLHMSKKTFKKAVGALYKEKRIAIETEGIRLLKD